MSRPRLDRPLLARRGGVTSVNGPSLEPVFQNFIVFVNDIVRYSNLVFVRLHNRDDLEKVQDLMRQSVRIKSDASDIRRSQFDGLRRLCTDRQPECIVLDELDTLRAELRSVYKRLLETSRDVLQDPNAGEQCESFQEFDEHIADNVKVSRAEWTVIPHHPDSPLCRSAARMIESNDIGSIRRAQTTNHQERGILRQREGLFQEWQCSSCPRSIKFFVTARNTSLESAAFPPRVAGESFHKRVAWRDVWCAKSHLKPGLGAKYACLLCLGEGRLIGAEQAPCAVFDKSKALVKHIADTHSSSTLPKVFMRKLHITEEYDKDGARSDLKFLRE